MRKPRDPQRRLTAIFYRDEEGNEPVRQFIASLPRAEQDALDAQIDRLNDLDDAVVSVASYLRKNGWGSAESQQRAAVHHYNNSNAYVDCVLTLAAKVSVQPASQPRQ